MLLDLIPSKYILCSLAANGLVAGALLFQGAFESFEVVSLAEPNQGSVDVLFSAQPEEIRKELKKQIKKIVKQKQDVADLGDKAVELEEVSQQVNLEDIKSLKNVSPELKAFLKSLQNKISERQVYPYAAKRLRQSGQVVVRFDVRSSGEVENVSIYKRSEFQKLNASAFELIAGILKVDHFPKEVVKSDRLSITVPIEYKL